jgi:hypothetical protein
VHHFADQSGGDDFVVDPMEADRFRPISVLEVTSHGLPDGVAELVKVVGFGEDRRADRARRIRPSAASSTIKRISVMRFQSDPGVTLLNLATALARA